MTKQKLECNSCEHVSDKFDLVLGKDIEGEDAPASEWFECPECNWLNAYN